MMRFTFLQLCAATVPEQPPKEQVPQHEPEPRSLVAEYNGAKVQLTGPDFETRPGLPNVMFRPEATAQSIFGKVAKDLKCDPGLVMIADDEHHLTNLFRGNKQFWAYCPLNKDSDLKQTLEQLALTGFALWATAHNLAEAKSPQFTHLTGGGMKCFEVQDGRIAIPGGSNRYSYVRQTFSRNTGGSDIQVSWCADPNDEQCKERISITIEQSNKISIYYFLDGELTASMERAVDGTLTFQGNLGLNTFSSYWAATFAKFLKNVRVVTAEYFVEFHEMPNESSQERWVELWKLFATPTTTTTTATY